MAIRMNFATGSSSEVDNPLAENTTALAGHDRMKNNTGADLVGLVGLQRTNTDQIVER